MEQISDDVLLQELNKRFLDTKKALQDMKVMNEKIEKLNSKLAESERMKSNFLSNIRNEINNPLTSILGMARELAGPGKDETRRQVMADLIYTEAFELDFQLSNIFMAAELEAGEARLSPAKIGLDAIVNRLVAAFGHKAREKKIVVEILGMPDTQDEKLLFTTDPEKLRLIAANLLANAIEFTPDGTRVTLEVKLQDKVLNLAVRDQGQGIPEAERKRLFERFHQLDQGSTKKHRGHGLGLSITKALAEVLGGKVNVSFAPDGGTVVQVSVPELTGSGGDIFSEDGNEFLFQGGSCF
jgi:signal transduction histidine kinase